ncbi:MAG TPA: CDP-diacylglycerol--serine O-phosphatidyltransferase [Bacteroidales bacterium]|nr:CDP-diacylglycerol--serine O-phosphatidyltransferase [Bacteroidales bacterium]
MKKYIPNLLTLLNLVSGFIATIFASKGYIEQACFLIMAGMVFDFSDGFAARLLKAYSDIGKDLDSLADVVTFGVAPGAIIYFLLTGSGLQVLPAIILSSALPAASALRLAKFNNDMEQSTSFKGMATPASAFTVVSFVIASGYTDCPIFDTLVSSAWFAGGLSVFLAVMMLINTRMFSLKFSHLKYRGNEERYIFAGVSIVLILVLGLAALPMIMLSYILISLLFVALRRTGTMA